MKIHDSDPTDMTYEELFDDRIRCLGGLAVDDGVRDEDVKDYFVLRLGELTETELDDALLMLGHNRPEVHQSIVEDLQVLAASA